MSSRDPGKKALKDQIAQMSATMKGLEAHAVRSTDARSLLSLHATLGSKFAKFIPDIKTRVLTSPDDFYTEWLAGMAEYIGARGGHCPTYSPLLTRMFGDARVGQYVELFVKRTFLRQADDLSKKRPTDSEAEIWLGQNHANYGLLVSPRFNARLGDWENDKSEIRHFPHPYFTIRHVLHTGLVIPGKDATMPFADVDHYLNFFEHGLVRLAGSPHQNAIAARYVAYVKRATDPVSVPLLLPEVRFSRAKRHQYRLDFMVVEPSTMVRVGFELSPWSTHGRLAGTRGMSVKAVNAKASANRDIELGKVKAYFREHGIYTLVLTDKDLSDPDDVFDSIAEHLRPPKARKKQQAEVLARLRKLL